MRENKTRIKEPIFKKALIMLVLCMSITGASAYLLKFGVTNWNYLQMKDSEVAGTIHINPDIIHIALSEFKGENLYLLEDDAVRDRLAQLPCVKDVKILRIFPSTLKVVIEERLPIAYIQTDQNEYFLIDEQGVLLDKIEFAGSVDMPVFCEISINNLTLGQEVSDTNFKILLNVYKALKMKYPDFLASVAELYIEDGDVIISEQERGVRFIIGDRDFDERLEKLVFAYQNFGVATYSEIDVRFSDPIHELVILR
ncbi:MAG: FtsQ-type POTRA domain-containing protein [Candidatus Celaenobacter antarcticus]|nr:FtsQ-type POTRA domain-containing protein [Candidatus Celaenobacter antarcticus]